MCDLIELWQVRSQYTPTHLNILVLSGWLKASIWKQTDSACGQAESARDHDPATTITVMVPRCGNLETSQQHVPLQHHHLGLLIPPAVNSECLAGFTPRLSRKAVAIWLAFLGCCAWASAERRLAQSTQEGKQSSGPAVALWMHLRLSSIILHIRTLLARASFSANSRKEHSQCIRVAWLPGLPHLRRHPHPWHWQHPGHPRRPEHPRSPKR